MTRNYLLFLKLSKFNNTIQKVQPILLTQLQIIKILSIFLLLLSVIFQTLKYVQNIFDFNTTSNPHSYLVLFVFKTLLVVYYFIMDLISLNLHSYLALIKSKSTVIFICFYCLIIFFKLCKFTQTLYGVFPSPSLNSYVVFYY